MNIPGVTALPPNNALSATPPTPRNTMGKDDFMRLLVTQLSTQDPLKPMDSQDFGAQLAQFSSLEQMTNVNANLTRLQQIQGALSASSSVNLIGRRVEAEGNGIQLASGVPQSLGYSLGQDARSVSIEIFDATGNRVTTLAAENQTAGVNSLTWNGRDASGNALPAGTYTFNATAVGASGNAVTTTTYTSGVVSDVIFENGVNKIVLNGVRIPMSQVSRIS